MVLMNWSKIILERERIKLRNLKLYLLGSPRLELDGSIIEMDTRKALALLAYLVVTKAEQQRDSLAALLWPEYDHAHALGALRRTLSALRKAVGEENIAINRERVLIQPESRLWSDFDEFHNLLSIAKTHGHSPKEVCPACIPLLERAARLYRGDFLAGFSLRDSVEFDDWQFFQSEALRRELAEVLERLVEWLVGQENYSEATVFAQRWLAMDPLHEPAHRVLMQLFAWSDQRSAALRQYQECEKILEKELGVRPLEETVALNRAIKENRLPAPTYLEQGSAGHLPHNRSTSPLPGGTLPLGGEKAGSGEFQAQLPAARHLPLVGRSLEWRELVAAYERVGPDGFFIVLQGEPGIGKTRLAEDYLDTLRTAGAPVLAARSYQGESGLAYGPFIEILRSAVESGTHPDWVERVAVQWLSEASRLLPELQQLRPGIPLSSPLETPGAQTRFFESISQVLLAICGVRPFGALFFDDLHWADEASIDLLTYLVRRLSGRPIFWITTWRSEDVPQEHRLRRLLAEVQRSGYAGLLSLAPLSEASVEALVQSALPVESAPPMALSQQLYQETDGLPFFVVEYLKEFTSGTALLNGKNWVMPGSVRDLLHSRLVSTPDAGRQLLQAAAVIGRAFDFEIIREVSGRSDEETLEALETLIRRDLVHEVDSLTAESISESFHNPTYDFSHEKIRALVYEETSAARRKILHRRVAGALAGRAHPRRELENRSAVIARHYLLASQPTEAAVIFRQAGEHARSLYANGEALTHFKAALDLGHPQPASIFEAIGDLQTLSGDYLSARSSYENSIAQFGPDSAAIARVDRKLGNLYDRHGEWDLAEKHFKQALDCLGENAAASDAARIYADWSLAVYHRGQPGRAQSLAHQALELAQAAGDPRALAQAYNIVGVLARYVGDFTLAKNSLEHSLSWAESLNEPGARAAALNNLALVHGSQGDLGMAVQLTETALNLSVVQGDRHREAALHNNLADLLHLQGKVDAAMSHLKLAVAIFAEIGAEASSQDAPRSGGYQPEIWKLSEW